MDSQTPSVNARRFTLNSTVLYPCQFASSVDQTDGDPGALPFGVTSPVSPPGSCPVHPAGPIEDGTQLVDLIDLSDIPNQVPGLPDPTSSAPIPDATSSESTPDPTSSVSVPPSTASDAASSNEGALIVADTEPSSASDASPSSVTALLSADVAALTQFLTPRETAVGPRIVRKRRVLRCALGVRTSPCLRGAK